MVTEGLRERKAVMVSRSDAFIALPGGIGTLDEFFDVLSLRQLGYHDKPIVLLNQAGYWEPFKALVAHQVAQGYVRRHHAELFTVVETVRGLFEAIFIAPEPCAPERQARL